MVTKILAAYTKIEHQKWLPQNEKKQKTEYDSPNLSKEANWFYEKSALVLICCLALQFLQIVKFILIKLKRSFNSL